MIDNVSIRRDRADSCRLRDAVRLEILRNGCLLPNEYDFEEFRSSVAVGVLDDVAGLLDLVIARGH